MPEYLVTDPATGLKVKMTGPMPPSEGLIRLALAKVQPLASHAPTSRQTPDPMQALQKAQSIGPAQVGERYLAPLNPSLVDVARKVLGGAQRPASVAAEDPYGIGAWLKGAGPMPTPIAAEIQAYHGSPHDFEKFLLEKIGTGEGAQAYGHGLYFAENPAVAHEYRKTLTNLTDEESRTILDVLPKQFQGPDNVRRILADIHDSMAKGEIQKPSQFAKDYQVAPPLQQAYEKAGAILDNKGKTYHVSINADPDQFLDWDKPLSQQPPKVKEALSKLAGDRGLPEAEGGLIYQTLAHDLQGETMRPGMTHLPITDAKAQVADKLRQAGIPGIKYLDQGSRTGGEGTHNYVVFDDNLVNILKKYAVAGAVGAGGALNQLANPQLDPQQQGAQ